MAKRILVAVIFLPVLFVVMFFLPNWVWALVIAFIAAMACHELIRATGEGKVSKGMEQAAICAAVAIPLHSCFGYSWVGIGLWGFIVMSVSFWCAIRAYDGATAGIGFYHVMLTLFGGVLIPAGLACLVALKGMEHGKYLVLLAVLLAFITDGGAYFAGMFLGKHRGITQVSPKKSLEGYIGGFLIGIVFALAFGVVVRAVSGFSVSFLSLAISGFAGAVATMLGDLAFSLIKRQYGIKDYGNLLPGHGGMLDRFDSMIFCAPVVLFVVTLLPVF